MNRDAHRVERYDPESRCPAVTFAGCQPTYEAAFRVDERLDAGAIEAALAADRRRLYAVPGAGGRPLGFALVLTLTPRSVLLEYLAVDERHRSRGIGSALLRCVREHEMTSAGDRVFVEIEDPDQPLIGEGERNQRLRRAAFYRRNDTVPVPAAISYQPPSFGEAMTSPSRYLLLAISASPSPSFAESADALAIIARESYG